MTQSHSNRLQAQLFMRLIYEMVPTHNPFTIDITLVVQAFHSKGGHIPDSWPPDSLQHPELFFHLVERAAEAIKVEELAAFARVSTVIAFEAYLNELKYQLALPITQLCYLRAGMAAKLQELLIKAYPAH